MLRITVERSKCESEGMENKSSGFDWVPRRTDKFAKVKQNIASNMKQRRMRMDAIRSLCFAFFILLLSAICCGLIIINFKLLKQGKMFRDRSY